MQPSHRSSRPLLLLSLASLLLMPACASDSKSGDKAPKDENKPAEPGKDAADAGGEKIAGKPVEGDQKVGTVADTGAAEETPYDLQIDPSEAKVGEEGKVTIKIVPRGAWHMNLEFPTTLKLEPPAGVAVTKADLKKDDAVKLDETSAEFAVAFTPSEAGDKTFTGEFKFAICQEEVCSPRTEKLEFVVAVK